MKYLKLYENILTKSGITRICDKYEITDWNLNSDGLVDVNGNVWLDHKKLTSLPIIDVSEFKFGRVSGSFICDHNNLTSLNGSPNYVDDDFDCTRNNLTSLEGCPSYVGGDFWCRYNNIRSFQGIGHIGGDFYCSNNPISILWVQFNDVSKIEMFNEWSIIQGDNVILYRLNDFLQEIGEVEITEYQLKRIQKYYNVI